MFRKAPRLLALLAFVGLPAGEWRGRAADRSASILRVDGQTVSGIVRVSGFVLDLNSRRARSSSSSTTCPSTAADLNLPRPDVLEIFPTYYNSPTPQPGFLTSFLARGNYSRRAAHRLDPASRSRRRRTSRSSAPVTRHRRQRDQPGALRLHRHPRPGGPRGRERVLPRRRLGGRRRRTSTTSTSWSTARSSPVPSAAAQPSTANYGSTAPGRRGGVPGRAELRSTPASSANIDTSAAHQRHPHPLGARHGRRGRDRGRSAPAPSRSINNGQNLAPFGADRLPARQGVALLRSRTPAAFPSPCTPDDLLPGGFFNVVGRLGARRRLARSTAGQVSYVELLLDGADRREHPQRLHPARQAR